MASEAVPTGIPADVKQYMTDTMAAYVKELQAQIGECDRVIAAKKWERAELVRRLHSLTGERRTRKPKEG